MRVYNANFTSRLSCGCGSWLDHHHFETGSTRATCSVYGCGNTVTVGAHVINADPRARKNRWIVPMCSAHNHWTNTDVMELKRNVVPVSANASFMRCYVRRAG